ncbi:hypothetical protein HYV11_03775 [Candidatus Dependentiae bacterium]|nr:hypothetical protein [Candidatus Dependentiae bacterium]
MNKNIKILFFSLLIMHQISHADNLTIKVQKIENAYEQPLVFVESLRLEHANNDYKALINIYSCFQMPFSKLIQQLKRDIHQIKKTMKKEKPSLKNLYLRLNELSTFLRKHKFLYETIAFHSSLHITYQPLFTMIDNNQDVIAYITSHRKDFDLDNENETSLLEHFLKTLKSISHKISKFEDHIHTDYVDLKLQNYIYKVESIKLRNSILFDNRYKYRKG